MAYTYEQLRALPDDELIKFHDETAAHTVVGVNYALDELARRETQRQTASLIDYTNQIRRLTILIAAFTAVNVVLTIVLVLAG